ncbi:MAG TPA: hypothetical protein VGX69_01220 [Solirubrobacteraceae bacterium]|jgi:hypothetical protein|nr:hypothetical protein [Solirubrobacteraceae bacterium]
MKRIARIALLPATLGAAALLVACGSSSHPAKTGTAGTIATLTLTSTSTPTPPIASRGGGGCAAHVASALDEVGGRIYREASSGADVQEAVNRVQGSAALAQAISANDAGATSAALRALQAGQIVRIEIVKGGRVFASAGAGTAIAPVRGPIAGTDARFVLSTQAAASYEQVTRQVTGAEVVLLGGAGPGGTGARTIAATLAGSALPARIPPSGSIEFNKKKYEAASLAGSLFPTGALRVVLLVPSAGLSCPGSAAQTRVEALGHVGERIYEEEAGSAYVRATLHQIEASHAFAQAVAERNTAAIRAAIVSLFAAHIHVVRVRVYAVEPSGAQRFLYDLGGPYVLAPVHGTVRSGGREVGRFSFAIQDDAGYVKLARRFTGADVLMRVGARQVMGTLDPGPAHVPDRGTVYYEGARYEAYSFVGEAFPSGPLRISLLVPSRRAIGG